MAKNTTMGSSKAERGSDFETLNSISNRLRLYASKKEKRLKMLIKQKEEREMCEV